MFEHWLTHISATPLLLPHILSSRPSVLGEHMRLSHPTLILLPVLRIIQSVRLGQWKNGQEKKRHKQLPWWKFLLHTHTHPLPGYLIPLQTVVIVAHSLAVTMCRRTPTIWRCENWNAEFPHRKPQLVCIPPPEAQRKPFKIQGRSASYRRSSMNISPSTRHWFLDAADYDAVISADGCCYRAVPQRDASCGANKGFSPNSRGAK